MSKLIVEAELSVDGVIEGDAFWPLVFEHHDAEVRAYLSELLDLPDALVMGRVTYEGFAEIWPTREGEDADRINALPKYVASRTLKAPLSWNATLLEGDAAGAIGKLKQGNGGLFLQYGIGELTNTMLEHGLVDELRLIMFPFTVGEGRRLSDAIGKVRLSLIDAKPFRNGTLVLRYRPVMSAAREVA